MLSELLAPMRCVSCGAVSDGELCRRCAHDLVVIGPPICERCGGPSAGGCACAELLAIRRARSLVVYGGAASRLAVSLKRRGRPGLARDVGGLLAALVTAHGLADEQVAFVPAGSRADGRGFDHAELIARAVARRLGAPVTSALRRTRAVARQADTPMSGRRANADGAYAATSVSGEVLLVDDVMTTGATADACAAALLGAGARAVDVVTWARTLRRARTMVAWRASS